MQIKKGSTDRSVELFFADSTTGLPKTGLAYNSSGIDLWYRRPGAAKTSITEATLSALTDAHSDGGFLEIANGWYRLDLPDAAVATGAPSVLIGGTVTGAVCYGFAVELIDFDPQDSVRLGLTSLPNATAEAAGGLYTRGTGAGQINQPTNGMVDANVVRNAGTAITSSSGIQAVNSTQFAGQTITAGAGVTLPSSVASPTNITAGTITTVTNLTNAPTSGDLTSTMKASVNTEVLDVLNTDTFAEPGQGTPLATTTLAAKINYIYKAWRNKKTQTATVFSLFADDATTVDQKATVSGDGTTTTVGEIATGP